MALGVGATTKGRSASSASLVSGSVTTTSGSTILIGTIWDTASFTSVVDSKSNTWTQIDVEGTWGSAPGRSRVYYAKNITGGASHTFTLNLGAAAPCGISVLEITGADTTAPLDQHNQNRDISSPFTLSAGLTTTSAAELIASFLGGTSGSNPATHAETGLGSSTIQTATEETNGVSFYTFAWATKIVAATGTFNPSWTESGNTTEAQVRLATIIAAAGGGGGILLPQLERGMRGFERGMNYGRF